MWLGLAVLLATLARILIPVLQSRRDPVSRSLVFRMGVHPTGPGNAWTGQDRIASGLLGLLTAGICFGIAAMAGAWSSRLQAGTTADMVASGIVFMTGIGGLLAAVSGLIDLARAPFTRPWRWKGVEPHAVRPEHQQP